ncbi:hypothetical protein [Limnothrix sp. PR1529]|uniref:hypothetical protein n=1 Tax=Limnothrix sp. PR1529 TaxID=1704291 RepID=UPI00117A8337|nr:hypothetical protein [Limnothrix sp. PR1529]
MYTTQDRTAPVLPDIQRPAHAPITVTVEVPNQSPAPRPVHAPVSNWQRAMVIVAMVSTVGMVAVPVGVTIGRNMASAEINQANGAKAAAEKALDANRAQIENFCKSVK